MPRKIEKSTPRSTSSLKKEKKLSGGGGKLLKNKPSSPSPTLIKNEKRSSSTNKNLQKTREEFSLLPSPDLKNKKRSLQRTTTSVKKEAKEVYSTPGKKKSN